MNFDIIELIVEFIEENSNQEITKECIEETTQKSCGYVRNEFKKITNMTLDKYRGRRQLSIIIKEIKETSSDLNKFNLEPWSGENSFYKAFMREFEISPMAFIKEYDETILQQKLNINQLRVKFNDDHKLIEKITRIHGNKYKALKYLLTLKPYKLDELGLIFIHSEADFESTLIENKYSTCIGEKFFVGKVPEEFYKRHRKVLNEYYDLGIRTPIKQRSCETDIPSLGGYVITKRSVISKLIEEIDIVNLLDKEILPSMLRTLWYEEIKAENLKEYMTAMPNELENADIRDLKYEIIRAILFQEQGYEVYNTMEDLRKEIEFDYDKYIDNQGELCMKCEARSECEDDCKYFEGLSKEEQDNYMSQPDYEPLKIEKLLSEIKTLFLEGILYLDTSIIER